MAWEALCLRSLRRRHHHQHLAWADAAALASAVASAGPLLLLPLLLPLLLQEQSLQLEPSLELVRAQPPHARHPPLQQRLPAQGGDLVWERRRHRAPAAGVLLGPVQGALRL